MNQELRPRLTLEKRYLYVWLPFVAVAIGLVLAIFSYFGLVPLGYKLGPYWLNHWMGWLSFGFIIIYVPVFIILKRRDAKMYGKLSKVRQIGFVVAFILV